MICVSGRNICFLHANIALALSWCLVVVASMENVLIQSKSAATSRFEPYAYNGGSIVAIVGVDFVVIGADKQLIEGSAIRSQGCSRLVQVGPRVVAACGGCLADATALFEAVDDEARIYAWQTGYAMSADAVARLMSLALYSKRGFPYLAQTVVAGRASHGPAVYAFDSLGSFAPVDAVATGSAQRLIQPVLDDLAESSPIQDTDTALQILRTAFRAARKRDVSLGADLDVAIVDNTGIRRFDLALEDP